MGLILIDRHGKRTWCKKHEELHRGKRCPKCAAADKRYQTKLKKLAAWFAEGDAEKSRVGVKPKGYHGPVTMRELRRWGWVA